MNDRVIGIIKGLAVLKYSASGCESAREPHALVTSYPPRCTPTADLIRRFPKYLVRAMDAYFKYLTGKEDQLDADTKKALDWIHERGWHNAQFNREAMSVLNSKWRAAIKSAVRWSMFLFGKTELA